MAWLHTQHRVLFIVSLVSSFVLTGCASGSRATSPYTSAVIYPIPQSQALAIAREAVRSTALRCVASDVHIEGVSGVGIRGYEGDYRSSFYRFLVVRRLWLIRATGITGSGQQIGGFRFKITYDLFAHPETSLDGWPGGQCEKILASTLQTALDATGTATTVTSLRIRPYGEGRAGP
jgi:hypothetical protein